MTIRYRRGMTLGEFEAMIEQHRAEEADAKRYRLPVELIGEPEPCDHPYERLTTSIKGKRTGARVRIFVDFTCGECDEFLGREAKAFTV